MQVDFYHLTETPIDRALPQIAEKVVVGGGRLVIVAESAERRAAIDRLLWTYAVESFLPHTQAGSDDDSAQPILIVEQPDGAVNGARNIALVDGRWRNGALAFDRAFHFFDDEAIREARTAWRALADQHEVVRRYWRQNGAGRWEQAA